MRVDGRLCLCRYPLGLREHSIPQLVGEFDVDMQARIERRIDRVYLRRGVRVHPVAAVLEQVRQILQVGGARKRVGRAERQVWDGDPDVLPALVGQQDDVFVRAALLALLGRFAWKDAV